MRTVVSAPFEPKSKPQIRVVHAEKVDAPADVYALLTFSEISPLLDVRDFVQGVLIEGSSIVVYGQSNSGKTFWVTNLALHVAAGLRWHGLRVEQGGVIYCVLEGGHGFRNRVAAWKEKSGLKEQAIPFAAIQSQINLLSSEADVDRLTRTIIHAMAELGMPVRMVVIDTLARALAGGNENSPEDMGALVMNMDKIRQATNAAIVFVHHSGKDQAKGARGHSSLQAAIDTEIEVAHDEGGHSATVVKQRDMPKGQMFPFSLNVIDLGTNRHNEPVTTCVVEMGEKVDASASRKLIGHTKQSYDLLASLIEKSGATGFKGAPEDARSVPDEWWRERFYSHAMPGAKDDAKQKAFRRAADALLEKRLIATANKRVWLTLVKEGRTNDTP